MLSGVGTRLAALVQLEHEALGLAMLQSRSDTSTAAGSIDPRMLLLFLGEFCRDITGDRRLPKVADRLEKS
jgi:hypothetical protein